MPRRERVEGPFGAEMPIVVPFCASPSDRRACRSFCRLQCPRDAHPTGFFLISSSTFVYNVLSKDCTGDERHTRSFKDIKSDSRVLYRNNKRWVGCKDCPRIFSMRQLNRFDPVNTNLLIAPKKEGPRVGWSQSSDESVYLDGRPREINPAVFGPTAWPGRGQAFILVNPRQRARSHPLSQACAQLDMGHSCLVKKSRCCFCRIDWDLDLVDNPAGVSRLLEQERGYSCAVQSLDDRPGNRRPSSTFWKQGLVHSNAAVRRSVTRDTSMFRLWDIENCGGCQFRPSHDHQIVGGGLTKEVLSRFGLDRPNVLDRNSALGRERPQICVSHGYARLRLIQQSQQGAPELRPVFRQAENRAKRRFTKFVMCYEGKGRWRWLSGHRRPPIHLPTSRTAIRFPVVFQTTIRTTLNASA